MATVATTYSELRERISRYMGYSRTWGDLSTDQQSDVTDALKDMTRLVLSPPPLPGEKESHKWSFLQPLDTLNTTADQSEDTLTGAIGIITDLQFNDQTQYMPIKITSIDNILEMRSQASASGRPQWVAVVPVESDNTAVQSWKLYWYPTPNAVYTLNYRIDMDHNAMVATTNENPVGGTRLAGLWTAAALAVAELSVEDQQGVRYMEFMKQLEAAVSFDRQQNTPATLGRMQNPEPFEWPSRVQRHRYITYTSP